MKHYIYRITRILDSKFYIGMHTAKSLANSYMGSGKRIRLSIKKYGREAHIKEIIACALTRSDLQHLEKMFVSEEVLSDPNCLNLKVGGSGGCPGKDACIRGAIKRWSNHTKQIKNNRTRSDALKDRWSRNDPGCRKFQQSGTVNASKVDAVSKRKNTFAQRKHQCGNKNSQFGTCWITNGQVAKKIPKHLLTTHLNDGWQLGRKLSRINLGL